MAYPKRRTRRGVCALIELCWRRAPIPPSRRTTTEDQSDAAIRDKPRPLESSSFEAYGIRRISESLSPRGIGPRYIPSAQCSLLHAPLANDLRTRVRFVHRERNGD